MNEKKFRKHLAELAHGRHRPEEHDWTGPGAARAAPGPRQRAQARTAPATRKRTKTK